MFDTYIIKVDCIPDTRSIIVCDSKQEMVIIDLDTCVISHPVSLTEIEYEKRCIYTFTFNGTYVTCSQFDELYVYNIQTYERKMINSGASYIISCAISSDGSYIATGSTCSVVVVNSILDGEIKRAFHVPGGYTYSVAFSSDDRLLVACSKKAIHVWDIESNKELIKIYSHGHAIRGVKFSPDNTHLIGVVTTQFIFGTYVNICKILFDYYFVVTTLRNNPNFYFVST